MIDIEALEGSASERHEARLARLFDAHYARLYRLARRMASEPAEAQDLVQETFVRAAQAGRIPADANEEAWLVRVLVNLCRDRWRRGKVRRHEPLSDEHQCASPEAAYRARLLVQQALGSLPPRRRAIVVMHELEDADVSEIARTLGLAAVTVRWHLSVARKQLARTLGVENGRQRGVQP